MKLLVVEDEAPMRTFLSQGLSEEGYAVDVASDGFEADEAFAVYDYDAVVLDVMLPGVDGFALCDKWRAAGSQTPVLFLTAKSDIRSRVAGLDLGGDDYLVKPFAFEELLARLRLIVRRRSFASGSTLCVGDLRIDTARHEVSRDGNSIALTAREYQILVYLAHPLGRS